ncbi:MAG: hypothetical protein ACE5IL_10265 [Myxococcota bacterium]
MQLSVIVTVVDGGAALARCLRGLEAQRGVPALEVIVPWDRSVAGIEALERSFPGARFLALGSPPTRRPVSSAAGQHELFDLRRAAGLAAASGDLIAIVEDRGVPRPDWARQMIDLHAEPRTPPLAAVGGAVANGRRGALAWAVYLCDYDRYQPPFAAGPSPWLSDTNVCYTRRALEATRPLWRERYHETTVHWALARAGETLWLSPAPVCDQLRDDLQLVDLLRERFAWGRLYGVTRASEASRLERVGLALMTPLLPGLLWLRKLRAQRAGRPTLARFVRLAPLVGLLLAAWTAGELAAYLGARA